MVQNHKVQRIYCNYCSAMCKYFSCRTKLSSISILYHLCWNRICHCPVQGMYVCCCRCRHIRHFQQQEWQHQIKRQISFVSEFQHQLQIASRSYFILMSNIDIHNRFRIMNLKSEFVVLFFTPVRWKYSFITFLVTLGKSIS